MIFFSSSLTAASVVPPTALVYCATKGAVEQLTRVLAKQLGPRGVTVNCIAPGPTDTDMFRKDKTEAQINFFMNLHPQKRLGQPREVADVVAKVACPDMDWVSGQTLMVNGVRAFSVLWRETLAYETFRDMLYKTASIQFRRRNGKPSQSLGDTGLDDIGSAKTRTRSFDRYTIHVNRRKSP